MEAEEMGRPAGERLANSIDDLYLLGVLLIADNEDLLIPPFGEGQASVPDVGEEMISLLLDENYASLLQFQEVLFSSAATAAAAATPAAVLPPDDSSDCQYYCLTVASPLPGLAIVVGESSCKRPLCDICLAAKPSAEMFPNPNCGHTFCKECVSHHIAASLQENITAVKCLAAGCGGVLEPEQCREILPTDVFERWGTALCEAMLLGCRRLYCPFRDCSAPLLDDGEEEDVVRASECPHCHRLFCAQCGVPWHAGVECEEFQQLGDDEKGSLDLRVLDMAKSNRWKRCPACRFYVEKREGCLHITCRCGCQFCYGCGSTWSGSHTSCHT